MKKYTYVAIVLIAVFAGFYFSCQCNNPTIEEPEPTLSQPANPQDGAHTPSAGHGPGKHRGINNVGNTCYMNSALQTLFALYGNLIKKTGTGAPAGSMADRMLKLFNKVTKVDTSVITNQEIKDFYASMQKSSAEGGIGWVTNIGIPADASELLGNLWTSIGAHSITVVSSTSVCISGVVVDSVYTLPFTSTGSNDIQTLIDQNTINGVAGLDNNIFAVKLERNNHGTKNTADVSNPLNIILKQALSDLPSDKTYKLVGFIHHGGDCGGGHYIAYIKEGAKWICYNDSNVSEVSDAAAEAAAKQAYVFFYQPK